ncbi:hypothetical protein O1611_g3882 [Lasiodiplodia mahajangana]|uniref:Uncharacterized protein n=1 Tax=Lasiodiplodia mahajangana TaxID=1108764 RepID=A0ACC2JR73_9PEZI|nr:hypothetical protein O1611_g3882 [Lasiodiplodia mahajangana]
MHDDHSEAEAGLCNKITAKTEFSCRVCATNNQTVYKRSYGVQLTGIGVYAPPEGTRSYGFIAPVDSNASQVSDDGSLRPLDDSNSVIIRPVHSYHSGHIFHDSCWRLFKEICLNKGVPVSLERLFEVLDSHYLVDGRIIDWGHNYGGFATFDNDPDHYLPWERKKWGERSAELSRSDLLYMDPFSEDLYPMRGLLLEETPELPPTDKTTHRGHEMGRDPFGKLPHELKLDIARFLSVPEFLEARLALRAFGNLFYDQQFWAPRFAWLFEKAERRRQVDWLWLYRRTNFDRLGPELGNRCRIWKCIDFVVDTYIDLRWHDSDVAASQVDPWPCLPIDHPRFREVSGAIMEAPRISSKSCHQLRKCYIAIPANLSQFSISRTKSPSTCYITGIRFTTVCGTVSKLGYWTGEEDSVSVTAIWGFVLAVGIGGIQAIQCITGHNTTSRWLGDPNDVPKTRCLATVNGPLDDFLQVGFDGYKIVSLATKLPRSQILETKTLRSSRLWYPDIPGQNLSLNQGLSATEERQDLVPRKQYKPIFWTNFGGPGGEYLRHLIRLDLMVRMSSELQCIEFKYDIDEIPVECKHLGRFNDRQYGEMPISFCVDGPGGEIITAIEVVYKAGTIFALKATTSRDRLWASRCIGEDADIVTRTLVPDPGTTITGMYACQVVDLGLNYGAIGIISEDLST